MLGGCVSNRKRTRCGGRNRTVVDDATAHWLLIFHDTECFANAQEHAGEVGVDHTFPHFQTEFGQWNGGRADACVVEQQIDTAKGFNALRKQVGHGVFLRYVGGHSQDLVIGIQGFGLCRNFFQIGQAAASQHNRPAVFEQGHCRCFANARTSACDDGNF